MGKQVGPPYITGRVGDLCYYKLNGKYYVRKQSSLSRKRVKRGRAFQRTMQHAAWLAEAGGGSYGCQIADTGKLVLLSSLLALCSLLSRPNFVLSNDQLIHVS